MTQLVYLNGAMVRGASATVSVSDQGFLLGEGAFETLRCYGGRIFRLRAHVSRLFSTLRWLDIDVPESPEVLVSAAQTVVRESGLADARVRITVTAGPKASWVSEEARVPTRLIEARPLDAPPAEWYRQGIPTMTRCMQRGLGLLAGRKVTSYLAFLLARRAAEAAGAREAILVTPGGEVVEGAMSNLFVVAQGQVLTPPLTSGPLAGITRQVVLELVGETGLVGGEKQLDVADLMGAEEVFVTSSMAELLPVISVDGRLIGSGQPGATTAALLERYRALT